MSDTVNYKRPGWFTHNVLNRLVKRLMRMGVSVMGSRIVEVKGRRSGQPRQTAVNLLNLEGTQYLVSPRGHTEWVRNLRADEGKLTLILGRQRDAMHGVEITEVGLKVAILREYLRRWKTEVGIFFDGVGPDSTDEEIAAISDRHPVFILDSAQ